MSSRSIFNKYELLVAEVRKIAKKHDTNEDDDRIRRKAMLIASLSSNHSWKTYKYLHDGGELDKEAIITEANSAFSEGWKNITETDVEEIVNSNINEYLFSTWLFYAVEKGQREYFKELLNEMKMEFIDGMEPIERREE